MVEPIENRQVVARKRRKSARRPAQHLSQLLHEFAIGTPHDDATVGALVDHFQDRGLAAVLTLLALPIALPIPMPGISAVFGLPMLLIALQLAAQKRRLWLPARLRRRTIGGPRFREVAARMVQGLTRIERFLKPRLQGLCHPLLQSVYALLCAWLSLILFLPIPFGNVLPSLAIFVLGLAMLEKDGVAALAGVALACAGIVVTAGAAVATGYGIAHFIRRYLGL
jgi:hypothetical protein